MGKLIWEEKDSVGIKEMDDQHKIIFELINNLSEEENVYAQSETLTSALTEMTEYFWEHLKNEESHLKKYHYPDIDEHIAEHTKFKITIMSLNLAHMKHGNSVLNELIDFLKSWWSNHILTFDMRYHLYFLNKG